MLKRNWNCFEISCGLKSIIDRTLSNFANNEEDYINLLFISALEPEEKECVNKEKDLKSTITEIVNQSGKKYKKDAYLEYDEKAIKEMINEAFSISRAISTAPSFVEYVGNMTKENYVYHKLKEQLIFVSEMVLKNIYIDYDEPIRKFGVRPCASRFFGQIFSTILLEYYDILKETDIIFLIEDYNMKKDIRDDIELKIIYPLCRVLSDLIYEVIEYENNRGYLSVNEASILKENTDDLLSKLALYMKSNNQK